MPHSKRFQLLIKRLFDIVFSLAALIILVPVLAMVALVIRSDGGSVFHRSERIGRSGAVFDALKLRTMVPDAEAVLRNLIESDPMVRQEWYSRFKLREDPRITPGAVSNDVGIAGGAVSRGLRLTG